ncbi:putative ammonium transporter [Nymphon striatum]|nr:putative ammonium transporter [Nymphon striatum]
MHDDVLYKFGSGCAFLQPLEAIIIGAVGGTLTCYGTVWMDKIQVDDPVGAVGVHGFNGLWALIAVGLFAESDKNLLEMNMYPGLFKGGGFYLLGVQLFGACLVMVWSLVTTWLFLAIIDIFIPIRMLPQDEILGADFIEHNVRHPGYDYDRVVRILEEKGMHVHQKWCHVPKSVHMEEEEYIRKYSTASVSLIDIKRKLSVLSHED